jgi:hypothetical protein
MSLSIGPLQPGEVPAFCALFQRVFSVSVTPEWRHWKYEQGPRLGRVSLVARDATGALVGHAGALVFPGVAQGRSLPMAQVCDVMVDPAVRGGVGHGGTYGRLMAALQRELASAHPGVFAYGFAGIRPYKLGARMGLYRAVQPCRMGVLEFQADAASPRPPSMGLGWLPSPLRQWARWSAYPVAWNDPTLATIWRRRGPTSPGPQVQRTNAYLHWRYATHPSHRYQAWLMRRWGRAHGWVVARTMSDGHWCVVDYLLPADLSVAVAAENLAAEHLRAEPLAAGWPLRIGSWDVITESSARLEPVMGCEVRVGHWHSDEVTPRFQPGDTDVF